MVSALDGPGSSPGCVHCVVFFGKTVYYPGDPRVQMQGLTL